MSTENQQVFPRKFKFFRVLLLGFCTKLAIPQRLTNHFIKESLTSVTLLSPLGKSAWNVRIGGDSRGLHFAEGWERFAAAHRLSFGDFLVFKYVGGIVFHVTIFDKSTCEKNYKISNGVSGDDVPSQGKNCDQESECFKGKPMTPPSSGQRTPPVMEQEFNKDESQVSVRKEVQKTVHKAKKATKRMCKRGSRFQITISDKLKYAVRIPIIFSRSNDLSNVHQLLLRDPEGHPWPVNLLHCKHSISGQDWVLLSAGWREFHIGNELKDGDVCIFEVKKKNEMLVQIHRSYVGFEKQTTPSSCDERTPQMTEQESNKDQPEGTACRIKGLQKPVHHKAREATKQGYESGSHFEITIGPKCKYYVNIPASFARSNDLSSVHQMLLVDPSKSDSWPVKLLHCKQSIQRDRYKLSTGWRDFHVRKSLKDGDVCIFDLKKKNEMFVQIHRTYGGGSCRSKSSLQQAVQLKRAATFQQKGSPSKVARTSKPVNPVQFRSTIVPTNACKHGYLTIPRAFLSLVDLSTEKEAVLVDPNFRQWSAKIYYFKKRGCCRIGHGWTAFCKENDVEVGDVCIFSFKYRGREATFQIEVIKSKVSDGSRISKSPLQQAVQLKKAATFQQKGSPSKVARTSKPADPVQFRSTIIPTNIRNDYLTIPRAFFSLVDLSTEREAVLVDPISRQWPVKIRNYEKQGWCRIGPGWTAFCKENDVEAGDVCIFSFKYKGQEATFEVEVIKSKVADGSSRSKSPFQQAVQLKRAATFQQRGSQSKLTCTSKPVYPVQFTSTIVPTNVCKHGYLTIPKAFLSLVDLSTKKEAILVDPNSRQWPVKIHSFEKRGWCWIGLGWKAFCEENDVEVGDVCIFSFKYRGREATFHVEVIKWNAADGSSRSKSPLQHPVQLKRAATFQLKGSPSKVARTSKPADPVQFGSTIVPSNVCRKRGYMMMQQKSKKDQEERSACRRMGLQKPVRHKTKDAIYKQGCKMGSHFEITISPKYKNAVNIPLRFARSNNLSSVYQMLLIRDPSSGRGGPWPVKLYHYKLQSVGHDSYLMLTTGWRDFRVGNDLKDGDVCVFQVKKKKKEMLVQIHRSCGEDGSKRSKCTLQQAVQLKGASTTALQQRGSPSKVTSASKPADPVQFRSTIVPTNLRMKGYMTIPRAFLSLVDLSGEKEIVLMDPSSTRRWPVKIRHHDKGKSTCRMGRGWAAFCKENDVEVGDVCIFNFKYRGREATFQVEVFKSKSADGCSRSKNPLQLAVQLKRAATIQQKESRSEVTHASKPADTVLQFGSTIVPSNICRKMGYMHIPRAFLSLVDLSTVKEVVLVDPNSRRWPMKIYHCKVNGRCRMAGGGWVRFCDGNDVEVGDVCIFNFKFREREATFQVEVMKSESRR